MSIAVITGCSGGIGSAILNVFQDAGYTTVGIDKRTCDQADIFIQFDLEQLISSEKSRKQLLSQITKACSGRPVKVLINNAAVQILAGIVDLSVDNFKSTMDINVTVPFILSKLLYNALKSVKGNIINIGSIHAKLTKPTFLAYSTSKAALLGLTQAMAVDFGHEIRTNAIQPGAIATEMLIQGFKNKPEDINTLKNYQPCGKIGTPEEIAKIALFLSSEDQCGFINGATIDANGGIGVRLHDPF